MSERLEVTNARISAEKPRLPLNTVRSMINELLERVIAEPLTPLVACIQKHTKKSNRSVIRKWKVNQTRARNKDTINDVPFLDSE